MRLAFVTPWYGENIPGGAETECRTIAENLQKSGNEVEILTTCAKEFASDWNTNFYKEGIYHINQVPVRRFSVKKRDKAIFDTINYKLIQNKKISLKEEKSFIHEMINSDNLYSYIRQHGSDYDFFLFIPYMFGTTYYGSQIHPEKSILIPCLHDESYARMTIYRSMFENVKGLIFLSEPEKKIANTLFDLKNKQSVLGGGINTYISYNAKNFRERYDVQCDYLLYAGRREPGKNVPLLIDYFNLYLKNNPSTLKLILIGSGEVNIPECCKKDIIDLKFIPVQDKYDAYAAATVLCQPSVNESFSIVIMESWLCGTPVLVHADCAVTKNHCIKSNGGLFFKNYAEFEECINYILDNPKKRDIMAECGKRYVTDNYSWERIVMEYEEFLREIN